MSMKTLLLDFELAFDTTENRNDSEELLVRLLGINSLLNFMYLRKNPDTLPLYESGVIYTPPDQADGRPTPKRGQIKQLIALLKDMGADPETAAIILRVIKGIEIFLDLPALYSRGRGDCNELVPVRIAELWRAGIMASPYLVKSPALNERGGMSYHAIVRWPDGSAEDVSLITGMGGVDRAEERAEEIRKNAERLSTYIDAAKHLIQTEGASPSELTKQIESIGLAPRDGVFKSPYKGDK